MINLAETKQQIILAIKQARHVVLVSHQKPDGDAAGSVLAMAHYLDAIDKNWTIFSLHELSPNLRFLPNSQSWQSDHGLWQSDHFDLIIVLDTGDLKYAGIHDYIQNLSHEFKIINIDHHPTNTNFGHYNLVLPEASSTCEIVHAILEETKFIDKKIATCLLTGIITDTSGFFNMATTSKAVQISSQLLLLGASIKEINQNTLQHRPINTLRLWGKAMERLYQHPQTGIIMTVITQKDLIMANAENSAIDGVANFLSSLSEAKNNAIAVLSEIENNNIKVSLRTTSPLLDVSKFAKLMGGGGHKKAAGYIINGSLIQTKYGWKIIKPATNPDRH